MTKPVLFAAIIGIGMLGSGNAGALLLAPGLQDHVNLGSIPIRYRLRHGHRCWRDTGPHGRGWYRCDGLNGAAGEAGRRARFAPRSRPSAANLGQTNPVRLGVPRLEDQNGRNPPPAVTPPGSRAGIVLSPRVAPLSDRNAGGGVLNSNGTPLNSGPAMSPPSGSTSTTTPMASPSFGSAGSSSGGGSSSAGSVGGH